MAYGFKKTNSNNIIQIGSDGIHCRVVASGISTATDMMFFGAKSMDISGDIIGEHHYIMMRNENYSAGITSGVGYFSQIVTWTSSVNVSGVSTPSEGSYRWLAIGTSGWGSSSGYGLTLFNSAGAIAFNTNNHNFVFTDVLSIPISLSTVSNTTDYVVANGGHSGDLYYCAQTNGQIGLAEGSGTRWFHVYATLVAPQTLRVKIVKEANVLTRRPGYTPPTSIVHKIPIGVII